VTAVAYSISYNLFLKNIEMKRLSSSDKATDSNYSYQFLNALIE